MKPNNFHLKTGTKLKAINFILNNEPLNRIVEELSIPEIIEFQNYIWELSVEFGIKLRGKKFTRKEITRNMPSTANYQRKVGCSEKIYYCKGTHCINSNPGCATKKIKIHVEIMAQVIRGYIQSAQKNEMVT